MLYVITTTCDIPGNDDSIFRDIVDLSREQVRQLREYAAAAIEEDGVIQSLDIERVSQLTPEAWLSDYKADLASEKYPEPTL